MVAQTCLLHFILCIDGDVRGLLELLGGECIIGLSFASQVAMATAAKAKLLLREVKAVKADLAFAKERCAQLEEENKILRESFNKGDNPADDDLVILLS